MDEKDFDNMRRAGTDAARQVGEAFTQIDFSGVSKSIEKAVRDVGRQLSTFGRPELSPYVISDPQDANRARWRMWVGFALDENIRGIILMRRWRSGKWRTKVFVG